MNIEQFKEQIEQFTQTIYDKIIEMFEKNFDKIDVEKITKKYGEQITESIKKIIETEFEKNEFDFTPKVDEIAKDVFSRVTKELSEINEEAKQTKPLNIPKLKVVPVNRIPLRKSLARFYAVAKKIRVSRPVVQKAQKIKVNKTTPLHIKLSTKLSILKLETISVIKQINIGRKEFIKKIKSLNKLISLQIEHFSLRVKTFSTIIDSKMAKIKTMWNKFAGILGKVKGGSIQDVFSSIISLGMNMMWARFRKFIRNLKVVKRITRFVRRLFHKLFGPILKKIQMIKRAILHLKIRIRNFFKSLVKRIKNAIKRFINKAISSIKNTIKRGLSLLWKKLQTVAVKAFQFVKNKIIKSLPILIKKYAAGLLGKLAGGVTKIAKKAWSKVTVLKSVFAKVGSKVGKIALKLFKPFSKTALKSVGKVVPGVGFVIGAAFAVSRAMEGDFVGAGLELASGLASTIPGYGTAASIALEAGIAARDFRKEGEKERGIEEQKKEEGRERQTEKLVRINPEGLNPIIEKTPEEPLKIETAMQTKKKVEMEKAREWIHITPEGEYKPREQKPVVSTQTNATVKQYSVSSQIQERLEQTKINLQIIKANLAST